MIHKSKSYRILALLGAVILVSTASRADQVVSITLDPASTNGAYFGTISVDNVDSSLGGPGFFANYNVPDTTDVVSVNLSFLSEHATERYLYGAIGIDSFNVILGGGGGTFRAGVPNPYLLSSDGSGSLLNGIYASTATEVTTIDVQSQFFLSMPWDGTTGDWTGTWAINWELTDPSTSPISSAGVPDSFNMALALGLMFCGLAAIRRKVSGRSWLSAIGVPAVH